ncbi:4'-phosphopantetheinyl transferase superfamily protein [Chamaesiphon sp.]|uniref:4'-phosphopantetheinyl transferase family protein n=1 Tax=Chamaesiphon sp. TaxID=2814140 RepID=UPI0035948450
MLLGEIHVWSVTLNLERNRVDEFSQFLTTQERQRAAKFINPLHGDRWIVARGYLRQILSQYLDLTPAQIVFTYTQHGKPKLEGSPIQFNLSHSGDRAVYGISHSPIGIDLEYIHPLPAADLVDRFFSPAEQAIFHNLPIDIQSAAFFHAWVQKEAYLKACGTGLSTPLDQIEVSIDPHTPATIVSAPIGDIWQIQKLDIPSGYAGAIVIGGDDVSQQLLQERIKYRSIC